MTHTHTCVCWSPLGTTCTCTTCTTVRESAAKRKRQVLWGSGCPLSQEVKAGRSEDRGRKSYPYPEMTCLWLIHLVSYSSPHVNSQGIRNLTGVWQAGLCHRGLLWGNSTYSCFVVLPMFRARNLFWSESVWSNCEVIIKNLLFSCEYTVLCSLATPGFVCFFVIFFLVRRQKQSFKRTVLVHFHCDPFVLLKNISHCYTLWDF